MAHKSAERLQGWRLAKKQLEVMEQLINDYITGSKRKSADAAASTFNFS